ncbi:MAG: hypothetical protein F4152_02455 [Dehalococcoidia bacterium]|nr:hypothetical protein [Dehalococcoidia bacterium]
MPRRRARPRRVTYSHPNGFAQSLARIKEASGLTWADLARELGTSTLNLWRWRKGVHPNARHLLALQDLARRMDLEHLLPRARVRRPPHR